MKFSIVFFLFIIIVNTCTAQGWEAEVMAGASAYNGDLTQKLLQVQSIKPAAGVNLKYNFDNLFLIRGGISWINVAGDDRYNKDPNLKNRNLNFKSTVWEATLCAELNLAEPELFYAYPYLFGGVGAFRFNPYTYDKDNKKTYLQPLGTEGQGIQGNRKPYSLTQFCLPVGGGWKVNINEKYDVIYEFGYRFLFTDYLDDVSTTYINPQTLLEKKGPKAAELAYRTPGLPDGIHPHDGQTRGNPAIKDSYFFTGIKLLIHLSNNKRN